MKLFEEAEKGDYLVQNREPSMKPFSVDRKKLGGATQKETYD